MNTEITITTIQSLTREAQHRGFKVYGGVTPELLIPMVEARISEHNTIDHGFTETSGDYIEWKQTMDDLQQFLALLRALPKRLPYEKPAGSAVRAANSRPAQSGPSEPTGTTQPTQPKNAETTREKIERLRKEIDQKVAKLPPSIQQQLTGVAHPSEQASDPRRTPVPDPSKDASDASTNAPAHAQQPTPAEESFGAKLDRERAEYLAQLLRESAPSKSPIDDLPPERQQTLYQLIQDVPLTVIVKMLVAPEPIGWNLKTCDTSLRRFKKRYKKKLAATERAQALAEAQETIQQTGADEQTYTDAARRLLKIRLYQNAADPEGSDEQIELLIRLLDRQRRTDLAERRVQVAEQLATQRIDK